MITFMGQFLLGGGLEEAGWRSYLLPYFYQKYPILLSSALVSIIWVFWHLPYFLTPDSMQADQSDFRFMLIFLFLGVLSVLLCINIQKRNAHQI